MTPKSSRSIAAASDRACSCDTMALLRRVYLGAASWPRLGQRGSAAGCGDAAAAAARPGWGATGRPGRTGTAASGRGRSTMALGCGCAAAAAAAGARAEPQQRDAAGHAAHRETGRGIKNCDPANFADAPLPAAQVDETLPDSLVWACRRGEMDTIDKALRQGTDINSCGAGGRTMLSYAVERDDMRALSVWLLERGADADARDRRGFSIVALAAWRNSVHTLLVLFRSGASPLTHDIYGLSPLHKAAGFVSTAATTCDKSLTMLIQCALLFVCRATWAQSRCCCRPARCRQISSRS